MHLLRVTLSNCYLDIMRDSNLMVIKKETFLGNHSRISFCFAVLYIRQEYDLTNTSFIKKQQCRFLDKKAFVIRYFFILYIIFSP